MKVTNIKTVRCSGKITMNGLKNSYNSPSTSILVVERASDIPLHLRKRSVDGEIPDFENKGNAILRGVYYKTASFYGGHRIWFDYVLKSDLIVALDAAAKQEKIKKNWFPYLTIREAFERGETRIPTVKVSGSGQWTTYKDYVKEVKRILDRLVEKGVIDTYAMVNDAPNGGKYGDFADILY